MSDLNDPFFAPVDFKGAFGNVNWASSWTALGDGGYLTMEGSGDPANDIKGRLIMPEIMAIDGGVAIGFDTEPGVNYQIQVTLDLVNWIDFGAPITGIGNRVSLEYQFVQLGALLPEAVNAAFARIVPASN